MASLWFTLCIVPVFPTVSPGTINDGGMTRVLVVNSTHPHLLPRDRAWKLAGMFRVASVTSILAQSATYPKSWRSGTIGAPCAVPLPGGKTILRSFQAIGLVVPLIRDTEGSGGSSFAGTGGRLGDCSHSQTGIYQQQQRKAETKPWFCGRIACLSRGESFLEGCSRYQANWLELEKKRAPESDSVSRGRPGAMVMGSPPTYNLSLPFIAPPFSALR